MHDRSILRISRRVMLGTTAVALAMATVARGASAAG
jgi:hypothetical protein